LNPAILKQYPGFALLILSAATYVMNPSFGSAGFLVKAIEDNYANSNWDYPHEDALFSLEIRNVEQRMEEATAADVENLRNVAKTYRDLINREASKITNADDLHKFAKQRDDMILKNLDTIQKKRKSSHMPPLLFEDLQEPYLKQAYERWEVVQTYF
jgi:hypothetical protein